MFPQNNNPRGKEGRKEGELPHFSVDKNTWLKAAQKKDSDQMKLT